MKNDIDILFVGGPYNGNSFNVAPESTVYQLLSHGSSYSTIHTYIRKGDKFVYEKTETNGSPQ
jgi:hypothetical protein